MNLFKVVDSKNNKVVKDGFSSKSEAKDFRKKLNKTVKDTPEKFNFLVNRSTDHWRGVSKTIDKKRKRQW